MRQKGKSLAEKGYGANHVMIYRAVPVTVNTFKPMDYVAHSTKGKKWVIQHCQHMVATEEEPYHVMYAMVKARDVYDAYNPGEYFYDGLEIPAQRIVYSLTPEQLDNL